ncbi:MAG: oxidoreductase [Pirellula sp.]|jgi:coenzyme F420-reducing hydrogenase gamma subunit|nr:oxidoreductase [Pirellula sp.]
MPTTDKNLKSNKPTLAVMKFASCDGCQLTILDMEDELLALSDLIQISHFAEASSRLMPGPYDVTLVEGSITTQEDRERINHLRQVSQLLVSIGACATSGGIQALRNFADHDEFMRAVYARPEYIKTLSTSTPISDHVRVDFELRGCPVDKQQLLEVLLSLIAGQTPRNSTESVCPSCKRRGTVCVVVSRNIACLGPVTQAGCGAICPAFDRGCYGCFGPSAQPNLVSLRNHARKQNIDEQVVSYLNSFNVNAQAFRSDAKCLNGSHSSLQRGGH